MCSCPPDLENRHYVACIERRTAAQVAKLESENRRLRRELSEARVLVAKLYTEQRATEPVLEAARELLEKER